MTDTFASLWLSGIRQRWSEIDLLIAESARTEKKELSDALLRSAMVLIVAHFEGDLKTLVKSVIDDGNRFAQHSDLPKGTRRTFCRFLLGNTEAEAGKSTNEREERLMEVLASSNAKIDSTPFLGGISNPNPETIRKMFQLQGLKNPFPALIKTCVDELFEGIRSFPDLNTAKNADDVYLIIEKIPLHTEILLSNLLPGLDIYPYKVDFFTIGLDRAANRSHHNGSGTTKPLPTLWESFLNELLRQRHGIAHGSDTGYEKDMAEAYLQKNKAFALLLLLAALLCGEINSPE